jgi:hypothetical protein
MTSALGMITIMSRARLLALLAAVAWALALVSLVLYLLAEWPWAGQSCAALTGLGAGLLVIAAIVSKGRS